MKEDDWVIFYPEAVRDRFTNLDLLWQQSASLGQVRRINSETITVYYESRYGSVSLEVDIPQRFVKFGNPWPCSNVTDITVGRYDPPKLGGLGTDGLNSGPFLRRTQQGTKFIHAR